MKKYIDVSESDYRAVSSIHQNRGVVLKNKVRFKVVSHKFLVIKFFYWRNFFRCSSHKFEPSTKFFKL